MNPKKFKKGKHTYTDWGKGIKEVKKVSEVKKNVKKDMPIKIDEETALGQYANLGYITHSAEEFTLDFIYVPPGASDKVKAQVVSRVIVSPGHAKRLVMALSENVAKYESKHGVIKPGKAPEPKMGLN